MSIQKVRDYRHNKPNICLNEIGTAVCGVFGITEKDLRSRKSANYIAQCMCVYLARMKTNTRFSWYYEYFKGLRSDDVLNMSNLMRHLVRKDNYLFNQMQSVISKIG